MTTATATPVLRPQPAALPLTPVVKQEPGCLKNLVQKVRDFICSRWTKIIAAVILGGVAGAFISVAAFGVTVMSSFGIGVISAGAAYALANNYLPYDKGLVKAYAINFGGGENWIEFAGDYSPLINDAKKTVRELLIGQATGAKTPTPAQLDHDAKHGPTMENVFGAAWVPIFKLTQSLPAAQSGEFIAAAHEYAKLKGCHVFGIHQFSPSAFTKIEQECSLAAKAKTGFDLPIPNSRIGIQGDDANHAILNLGKALLKPEVFALAGGAADEVKKRAKSGAEGVKYNEKFDKEWKAVNAALVRCAGDKVAAKFDWTKFQTSGGEIFWYLAQNATNFRILGDHGKIAQMQAATAEFNKEMGNPEWRANKIAEIVKDGDILAIQECSLAFHEALKKRGFETTYFDEANKVRSKDGSVLALNTKTMKPKFSILPTLAGDDDVRKVAAAVSRKDREEELVVASIHGSSSIFENGINQLAHLVQITGKRSLILGFDTNAQTLADEARFVGEAAKAGLQATDVGRTEDRLREFTTQFGKTDSVTKAQKMRVTTSGEIVEQSVSGQAHQFADGIWTPSKEVPVDHRIPGADIRI